MSLDLLESFNRVSKSSGISKALSGAYFCSAITFLQPGKPVDYWDLNYYNPKNDDISHVHVSKDSMEVRSVDKPIKKDLPKKIDVSTVKIGVDESIRIATEMQEKHYKSTVQKIFASLYSENSAVWAISFIMAGMKIFQVRLDALDGKIIDSKLIDFLQKSVSAS